MFHLYPCENRNIYPTKMETQHVELINYQKDHKRSSKLFKIILDDFPFWLSGEQLFHFGLLGLLSQTCFRFEKTSLVPIVKDSVIFFSFSVTY